MAPTEDQLRAGLQRDAERYLIDMLGSERGKAAAARVAMAFGAAIRSARDPNAFLRAAATADGRASFIAAIAMSAITGLMPGGPNPTVYLVPKGGQIHWWITHRGITTLALRAGYQIIPVPVHRDDEVTVEFGEVTAHEPDPDLWADNLGELRGVYLTIRRLSDGARLGRPWMPIAAIEKRRRKAQTAGVWNEWGVEQAQKTAIKWAMSRGMIPIEAPELAMAMEHDAENVIDVQADAPRGKAALLEDRSEAEDIAQAATESEREVLTLRAGGEE